MNDSPTILASTLSTRQVVALVIKEDGKKSIFEMGQDEATAFVSRVRVDMSRCREAYRKKQQQDPKLKMRQFRLKSSIRYSDSVAFVTMWIEQSEGNQFDEVLEDMGIKNAEDMVHG